MLGVIKSLIIIVTFYFLASTLIYSFTVDFSSIEWIKIVRWVYFGWFRFVVVKIWRCLHFEFRIGFDYFAKELFNVTDFLKLDP